MRAVLFLHVPLPDVVTGDFYGETHLREVVLLMGSRTLAPDLGLANVWHFRTAFLFLLVL